MKIITIFSAKGGSGKTNVSTSIAGCLAKNGHSVLLVDDDQPQHTAGWIGASGNLPFEVINGWPSNTPEVDYIVHDTSPRMTHEPAGSIVLIPIRPTAADLKSVLPYLTLLKKKTSKTVIEIISQLDARIRLQSNIALIRKKEGALTVKSRSIYQQAVEDRTTIFDTRYNTSSAAREARKEITVIYREIMK